MSKRDEFVEQMKIQLDALNLQVDEIEGKMKKAKDDVKIQLKEKLLELREKRAESKQVLTNLAQSGEDKWEALKGQAEKTRKALEHSIHYFMSQMK